jgi:hypothetical protein
MYSFEAAEHEFHPQERQQSGSRYSTPRLQWKVAQVLLMYKPGKPANKPLIHCI